MEKMMEIAGEYGGRDGTWVGLGAISRAGC